MGLFFIMSSLTGRAYHCYLTCGEEYLAASLGGHEKYVLHTYIGFGLGYCTIGDKTFFHCVVHWEKVLRRKVADDTVVCQYWVTHDVN